MSWSVIGLDRDDCLVRIEDVKYEVERKDAALIHSILYLSDVLKDVREEIELLKGHK